MSFRLLVHWPSDDILPMTEDYATAFTAAGRYRELQRGGVTAISIFSVVNGETSRISPTRLAKLSRIERRTRLLPRRARHTVASVLLGIVASALPNSFGDFGVVSSHGMLRAARTSRSSARRVRAFGRSFDVA